MTVGEIESRAHVNHLEGLPGQDARRVSGAGARANDSDVGSVNL